jgi:hypothetical protein
VPLRALDTELGWRLRTKATTQTDSHTRPIKKSGGAAVHRWIKADLGNFLIPKEGIQQVQAHLDVIAAALFFRFIFRLSWLGRRFTSAFGLRR